MFQRTEQRQQALYAFARAALLAVGSSGVAGAVSPVRRIQAGYTLRVLTSGWRRRDAVHPGPTDVWAEGAQRAGLVTRHTVGVHNVDRGSTQRGQRHGCL